MAFFKNAYFRTSLVVVICLSLIIGVLHYLQQVMLQQHMHAQQMTADMLVSSLGHHTTPQSLTTDIDNRLEQLPGWQAAIYYPDGQLQWQTTRLDFPVMDAQEINNRLRLGMVSVEIIGDEEWSLRYFQVSNAAGSAENIVVLAEPLAPVQKKIQTMVNLVLGVSVLIGIILWLVIKFNSRSLKAEIRTYIRHHRKELTRDNLTGLYNREILLDRIEHGFAQARRNQDHIAIVYMGLDRFAEINKHFGHAFGDQVLRTVASRLAGTSRASDTLVRIESDEFALLLTGVRQRQQVEQTTSRIIQMLQQPVELGAEDYFVSASIGIAITDDEIQGSDELLFNAYTAMKEVKRQGGGNTYLFFDKEMKPVSDKQIDKQAELFNALDNKEFCLYYQPRVDVVGGEIKGMQALLRWQHPHRGLLTASEFISQLEETGLILRVSEWVIREACRASKNLKKAGLPPMKVSVNISPLQLAESNFIKLIQDVLDDTGITPSSLELEITENCLADDTANITGTLEAIKKLGVGIVIDNFGTGYSSLSQLSELQVSALKIDRSVIKNLQDRKGNRNAETVTAIMALSHCLGMDVIAEGVETSDELAYLHALGCNTIQGFIFCPPLAEEEFRMLLQDDSAGLSEHMAPVHHALSQ